jgi:type II secretory pathway pseudopilin PulG
MKHLRHIVSRARVHGQRCRAFTIVEVIIALGIFMMIILSIYSIWTGIVKASIAARAAADQAQRARITMSTVQSALSCAQMFTGNMPPNNPTAYYTFIADMNQGDFGTLSFVAHLPATFPGVGKYGDNIVRRVTFSCVQGEGNTVDLVMRQGPMLQAASEDFQPYTLVLAKDVTMFGFECWGQPDPIRRPNDWDWVDKWESTNSLPTLMRIGLGLGRSGKRKDDPQNLTVQIVALPAKAVQPDWQNPMGAGGGAGFGAGRPGQPGQPARSGQPGPGTTPPR